jgi:predicted ATPase
MTGFIGREQALSCLATELDRTIGGELRCVTICGEAGSGKSTLVRRFLQLAENGADGDGVVAAVGQCTTSGRPFTPFRHALESLLTEPDASMSESHKRLARRLLRGAKELAPDVAGILLPGANAVIASARFLAEDLGWFERLRDRRAGGGVDASGASSLGDIDLQASALFRSLVGDEPLVLIIEDAHWIDGASVGLLHRLVHDLEGMKVMIVLTYRSSDVDARQEGEGSRHAISPLLTELGRRFGDIAIDLDAAAFEEGRAFCEELTAPFVGADGLAEHLLDVTSGLPLFAVEYLRLLEDGGGLDFDRTSGAWRFEHRRHAALEPASVRSVIRERLDRLDDDLLDLLEHCSIEGATFDAGHIASLMERNTLEMVRTLSRTLDRRHHIVTDAARDPSGRRDRRYRFHHDLIREQVYNALPGNYRCELHARFADVLSTMDPDGSRLITIARHRALSSDTVAAVEAYVVAALAFHQIGNAVESLQLLEQAGELARSCELPPDVEARLSATVGRIAAARRHWTRALDGYRRACELGDHLDDEQWSEAQLGQGVTLWRMNDPTNARLAFHRLLSSSRSASALRARVEATRHLAILQKDAGDLEGALALYEEVRQAAEDAGFISTLALVHNNIGFLHGGVLGDYEVAIGHYERAADVAARHGLRDGILFLRNLHTYSLIGDHESAQRRLDEAVALADEIGNPSDQLRAKIDRTRVWLAAGRSEDAHAELLSIASTHEDDLETDPTSHVELLNLRAVSLLLLGHDEDANEAARAAEQHLQHEKLRTDKDIGTATFCLGVLASRAAVDDEDPPAIAASHEFFKKDIESITTLRGSANGRWTLVYNEVLALCGAAATAPTPIRASELVDMARSALSLAAQLPGAAEQMLRLIDQITGPHVDALAPLRSDACALADSSVPAPSHDGADRTPAGTSPSYPRSVDARQV